MSSSAFFRTTFMCGSNPSRMPRYPRPAFSSTRTLELMDWFRSDRGLIIETGRAIGVATLRYSLWSLRSPRAKEDLNSRQPYVLEVNAAQVIVEYAVENASARG